jgi:protein O-GlcNAc transferase
VNLPADREVETLVSLLNQRRLSEAEQLALDLTRRDSGHALAWKVLGVVLRLQGRGAESLAPLQRTTELLPDDAEAHNNLGAALKDQGRLLEAEASCRRALACNPVLTLAHSNLGAILKEQGRLAEAEACFRRALVLTPGHAEAHGNLGTIILEQGRLADAEASFRQAVALKPEFAEAHNSLGAVLSAQNRLPEAQACFERAVELKPGFDKAHNNLGNALQRQGRPVEAEASYRRALELSPGYAEAHSNMGACLRAQQRLPEAEASARRALELTPSSVDALVNLGVILHTQGRLDEAESSYLKALALQPDLAKAHSNLGNTLKAQGRLAEAEASFRQALAIEPDHAAALNNLSITLHAQGRLTEAEATIRRMLELEPDSADAHTNLGVILQMQGRLLEAEQSFRRALEVQPDMVTTYTNLLFCLCHRPEIGPQELFQEHRRFGEYVEAPLRANWPKHANARDPERVLQVGFVSADLRNHAMAGFIGPLLAQLAAFPSLSLHAYYNHPKEDAVTEGIRASLQHWHRIVGLPDTVLAEKIRADGIDILIDLSGHTDRNRLPAFARKPAPLQASWMGYPGTTGLSAVDYYLTDHSVLPPGQFDDQYSEKIVQLPASAPFRPPEGAPDVSALPALANGHMTFGSFNRLSKLNPSVVALWSALLKALPDSRMVIGGMPRHGTYALHDWFAANGIAPERLSIHQTAGMNVYLRLHHQVDICLDTFPYSGGTTTAQALWMGVPTLTLAGKTAHGRAGVSMLEGAGLDDFVARDAADFLRKGLHWARSTEELAALRGGLRDRLAQAPIGQPALIAASLESALRTMWRRWCKGLPPESFQVRGDA